MIFLNTFLVGTAVYFLCAVIFITSLYAYFEDKIFDELEIEARILEQIFANEGLEDFTIISDLAIKNRITLVSTNGSVYFDNMIDISDLENHADRIEIVGALSGEKVRIPRYSDTMLKKTLYYAETMPNGDVIRISCEQQSFLSLLIGMSQMLAMMFVIAMIVSALIASGLSKKITLNLARIDFDDPEKFNVYTELIPFTKRIAEENYEKTQREELRRQFTANVSHELKTPLTSISGFAEIMKDGSINAETMRDFAGNIYEESQRMIVLINDIIRLSKLDEQSISMEKEGISLRDITSEVFRVLAEAAKKKNVTLEMSGDSGIILGVRQVIYEMIYNLCDNAIKYNKENGSVSVEISSNTAKKSVAIRVTDTGIGIPLKEQERVFERFYCVDKSRSKELGGTGLGLSIVKHGAKFHNADIFVQSKEGEGSSFTITFKP